MTTFETISDAITYVCEALQDYADEYDVENIARTMTDWVDGKLVMTASDDEFWTIVMDNEH